MGKWQNKPNLTNPKERHIPGSLDVHYSESPLDSFAKEQIGIALYKHHKEELKESETEAGAFLQDSQIVFLETPRDDKETFDLLMEETLEYPSSAQNSLRHLDHLWSVKGFHRSDPNTCVELLIGSYWTAPAIAVVGRRVGHTWVAPIYSRNP